MGNQLLTDNPAWEIFHGQDLQLNGLVHIFIIRTPDFTGPYQPLSNVFSPFELERMNKYVHEADRLSFTLRRSFLRQLLGRCLNLPPQDISFYRKDNRKIAVKGIEFNVSHTRNCAVIALAENPVGIDIEYVAADYQFRELLKGHFSSAEASFILQGEDPALNFYTLWTRKEALLKATGEGLTDDLDKVPSLEEKIHRNHQDYSVQSLATDNYVISTAASVPGAHTIKLWKPETATFF